MSQLVSGCVIWWIRVRASNRKVVENSVSELAMHRYVSEKDSLCKKNNGVENSTFVIAHSGLLFNVVVSLCCCGHT